MTDTVKAKLRAINDNLFNSVGRTAKVITSEVIRPEDVRIVAVNVQAIADELWKLAQELEY